MMMRYGGESFFSLKGVPVRFLCVMNRATRLRRAGIAAINPKNDITTRVSLSLSLGTFSAVC